MYIVITTTNNIDNARKLSKVLLKKRLAACIQQSKIKSYYIWQNKNIKDKEILLILKTKKNKLKDIKKIFKKYHNYKVPEFISIKIDNVSSSYLKWLKDTI
ncbi:divalent-cation tolerance protein CutA [Helicobacter sp. MIT 14-3879]|uniref:divalent-cation tolerance protein CutA n=1 Tax=Helicobacter sp. MIT 14-3879 TaxID=2040649 RepID=UPI000E1F6AFB|nr:divalent cation tolerance protein CutA [Helicobacter sp. MIT 14-3879]RDU64863.1 divalent-cation tolerance protein CutA [Helicobacter sp. MIT 14-3879]